MSFWTSARTKRGSTWSRAALTPASNTGSSSSTTWWRFASRPITGPRLSAHRPSFADHPKPTSPHDLLQHRCVNYRHGSGEIYRWELDKGDQSVVVAVNGPLITNDIGLLTRAALGGVGLAFMSEEQAAPHLATGALVRVLEDWCPPFPGFFFVLPEPAPAPSRTHRTHRDAARLRRTSYGLDLQPRSIWKSP